MLTRPESGGDPAVTALSGFIETGRYAPGDRLPPERELIGKLGMTRTTLRRALDALEREGLIWRHVGKGTFIATDATGGAADAVPLLARRTTPVKMMRARLTIEPAIAREAAINASGEARTRMRLAMDRAHAASGWREYEAGDDRFHRTVAEAADNLPLLTLFDQLNIIRRAIALSNVRRADVAPPADHPSFAEHAAIVEAIGQHDPDAAERAMRSHLKSVEARLFGE